jgi:hypothetical protein
LWQSTCSLHLPDAIPPGYGFADARSTLQLAASCRLNSRTGKRFGKEDFRCEQSGARSRKYLVRGSLASGLLCRIHSAIRFVYSAGPSRQRQEDLNDQQPVSSSEPLRYATSLEIIFLFPAWFSQRPAALMAPGIMAWL